MSAPTIPDPLCSHNASSDITRIFDNITTTEAMSSVGSQTVSTEYAYGSYIDEPLALINSGGTYFYADNRVYSPATLTDSSGTVVERYRYDSYGNRTILCPDDSVKTVQASAYGNQTGFTGRHHDLESGLTYFKSRYSSPYLGRFINRMPWENFGKILLSNYDYSLVVKPFSSALQKFKYSYQLDNGINRLSLYDHMRDNPAYGVEPYSPVPALAAEGGALAGEAAAGSAVGASVYNAVAYGLFTTYTAIFCAESICDIQLVKCLNSKV